MSKRALILCLLAAAAKPAKPKPIDSGSVKADKHGLVTIKAVNVSKQKRSIRIRQP